MTTDKTSIDPSPMSPLSTADNASSDEQNTLNQVDHIAERINRLETAGISSTNLKELYQYIIDLEVHQGLLKDPSDKVITRSNN